MSDRTLRIGLVPEVKGLEKREDAGKVLQIARDIKVRSSSIPISAIEDSLSRVDEQAWFCPSIAAPSYSERLL